MAAHIIQRKSIAVRWIPGHRQLSDARDAEQHTDILRNNEVDRLAKLATTLGLPIFTPTSPSSICLGGTEATTLAKNRIAALLPYPTYPGVHFVTLLPLRARRRQGWLQWLWGNIRWQGCSPPWEKTKVNCEGTGTMGWDGRAVGPYHPQMSHVSPPSRYHCPQTPHPLQALESRISQHVV